MHKHLVICYVAVATTRGKTPQPKSQVPDPSPSSKLIKLWYPESNKF